MAEDDASQERPERERGGFDRGSRGSGPRRPYQGGRDGERPRRQFDGERRPYGDRPQRSIDGDRPRRSFDGERRPYGDRLQRSFERDGERRPYGDRPQRSFDGDRPRRSFERDGERRPYQGGRDGDRPQRSFDGDRPRRSFERDGERRPYQGGRDGERPRRQFDGERRPYGDRPRRSFDGERPQRSFERDGERRPYQGGRDGERPRRQFDGERRPYGDRPQRSFDGDRPRRSFDGERPQRSFERDGERRPARGERIQRSSSTPGLQRGDRPRIEVPEIPEEVTASMMDKAARARLRTLSKDNAEDVGRHLVMAGQYLDTDPELAYKYAQIALERGGRVDVVREAAAVTAYATGRFAEALREFRTVRRLSGTQEHLPLMADCERGLGRPERAIAMSQEPEAQLLGRYGKAEMQLVVAGARADLGEHEVALVVLESTTPVAEEQRVRIESTKADLLDVLGRSEEAAAIRAALPAEDLEEEPDEEVVVFDVAELELDDDGERDADDEGEGGDILTDDVLTDDELNEMDE